MALAKNLVDDRENIPALDESNLIQLDETRLSKVGQSIASVIGLVGASVLTVLGLTSDTITDQDPGLVLLGAAFLLAMSLLSWALMASADIRARGAATAANLALRARPSLTIAPAGASGESSGLWCHVIGREKG